MSSKEEEVPPVATVEDESTATKSNGAAVVVDDPISLPAAVTASTASSSSTVVPKSKQSESDELTRRLQKLALERQKESKGDRLKVIQNDSSQQHLSSAKTFQELDLPKHLLEAIFAMGFDRPSAIQEEALPRILADPPRNLIGQAQSGSGKVRLVAAPG
jgi:ATP-dependent RNA helicase DDX19/DBP5